MAQKQSKSPWVWIFLVMMLASFVAFILFLDQKIVKSGADNNRQQETTGSENMPAPIADPAIIAAPPINAGCFVSLLN